MVEKGTASAASVVTAGVGVPSTLTSLAVSDDDLGRRSAGLTLMAQDVRLLTDYAPPVWSLRYLDALKLFHYRKRK